MRASNEHGGLRVLAVAGTDVVLLGMDMSERQSRGLMGFAIRRTDERSGTSQWLRGFKRFKPPAGAPTAAPGPLFTHEHPIQSFQWADYTVRPGETFTYDIVALRRNGTSLEEHESVSVRISTEKRDAGKHRIFFNRGAASSQAYARKFGERKPDEVGEEAYTWLSRGLFEGFSRFVGRAADARWSLRAALYECHEPRILAPLRDARRKGADVKIVFDARKTELAEHNEAALRKCGLFRGSIPRTSNASKIAHNKFIVLLYDDKPRAVWTGSMNLSINGVWGQSNVGHWVEDANVARTYLEYWERLAEDPDSRDLRPANVAASDLGDAPIPAGTTPLFSPRPDAGLLSRIGTELAAARAAFITLPFGLVNQLAPAFLEEGAGLRCMLLDSKGSAQSHRDNLQEARQRPNVIAAVGNRIVSSKLDAWVKEKANPWSTNVEYVHTKYALIDPLSDDPIVISGSANFSEPSITGNDENLLVIRGDTRVADIYLGEFRRLFDHHAFRESLTFKGKRDPSFLAERPEDWLRRHYDNGGAGALRRAYFSGADAGG
jgi:hypothetical protein